LTAEEVRAAVETVYAATIRTEGGSYPINVPVGVTPLSWSEIVGPDEDLAARAEGLAMAGLYYGCDEFAPLLVKERPAAQLRGNTKTHKRPRALIVYALGWKGDG
jgi:hypothetical protein